MLFDSTFFYMNQPFSTTPIYNVALSFSNKTGIILETKPFSDAKYFDCCWLSRFSNERELLFVQSNNRITIQNIINTHQI